MTPCPLCSARDCALWYVQERKPLIGRAYHRCSNCKLIFVPSAHQLSAAEEKAIYTAHENNPDDPGYRNFLSRAFEPVLSQLKAPQLKEAQLKNSQLENTKHNEGSRNRPHGLDFGCGPGPTLSLMFQEAGINCEAYDPFFANDTSLLQKTYDFITATEVFEHLSQPAKELKLIGGILKPGGILGIMTKRPRDLEAFKSWHYLMDPTHITFYSFATFDWIAETFGYRLIYSSDDVVLLKKNLN